MGQLTSREFAEFLALYELEPWGDEPHDLRAAATIAAIYRTGGSKATVREFMLHPDPDDGPAEASAADQQAIKDALARMA